MPPHETQSQKLLVKQKLFFGSEQDCFEASENIKIVDFDEDLIRRLETGERLVFKGTDNEKLVFCAENETYEVKGHEISNSLMICPDLLYMEDVKKLKSDKDIMKKHSVSGIHHCYLELRLTFPKLNKLRKILLPTAYAGPENEIHASNKGYYLTELLENIQCSREELLMCLKDMSACCIEGRWRILSVQYESAVLSLIIGLADEQQSNAIRKGETKKALELRVPDFILDHMFSHFTVSSECDEDTFLLREDKLCRSTAEQVLTAFSGKSELSQFMNCWKEFLPSGIEANVQHLRGLALIEEVAGRNVICLFQEYTLPENIQERFRLLFKRKEKWMLSEITPYIQKLATKSMNVNSMLTKFARMTTVNGVQLFSAMDSY